MFRLSEAASWIGASLQGPDVAISGVGSDTRRLRPGDLFVALRGERFDGHDYLQEAQTRGAVAAMVSRSLEGSLPQLVVDDTRGGLARLAAAWRQKVPGRVVALTGSNGKTTCKEMLGAVLGPVGGVLATQGNLNNEVGLPLTVLRARNEDYLVLEMGANHPGEIARLVAIAAPEVALITNAGRAHLEGFGSQEGVARAKGEIILGLSPQGTLVVPADSPWTPLWRGLAGERRVLTFGLTPEADVRSEASLLSMNWDAGGFRTRFPAHTPWGDLSLELHLAGRHNVRNALAVVAVIGALGLDPTAVASALATVSPVPGRLQPRLGPSGLRLVDDTYNANPDSVQAAIDVLAPLPGRRWLVLGDLAELGAEAMDLHASIGRRALAAGLDRLFAVGPLSLAAVEAFGRGAEWFEDRASLLAALEREVSSDDVVLVKGSRSAGMEVVLQALAGGGGG